MKKDIVFVTHNGTDLDAGLDYALDLAKMTDKGVAILLVNRQKLATRFDDIMSAVAFAEAGEPETARSLLTPETNSNAGGSEIPCGLETQCRESGIGARVYSTIKDTVSGIQDFLTEHRSVDMILLGPSITDDNAFSSRQLSRLVKTASRPVVTIARTHNRK